MSVEHRCGHIGVTEQFLHRANVRARLEQVGGKAVTKGMATRRLRYARLVHGRLHRALHDFLVSMMADRSACIRIPAQRARREDPLPAPLDCRGGVFARKRSRQPNSRLPQSALTLEAIQQFRKIFTQRRHQALRQYGHPILAALRIAHDDFAALEQEILDAKPMRPPSIAARCRTEDSRSTTTYRQCATAPTE